MPATSAPSSGGGSRPSTTIRVDGVAVSRLMACLIASWRSQRRAAPRADLRRRACASELDLPPDARRRRSRGRDPGGERGVERAARCGPDGPTFAASACGVGRGRSRRHRRRGIARGGAAGPTAVAAPMETTCDLVDGNRRSSGARRRHARHVVAHRARSRDDSGVDDHGRAVSRRLHRSDERVPPRRTARSSRRRASPTPTRERATDPARVLAGVESDRLPRRQRDVRDPRRRVSRDGLEAGEVVIGSVVEPRRRASSCTRRSSTRVRSRVKATVDVTGSPDSLIALADRVVSALILTEVGDHTGAVSRSRRPISPPALRAYLAGRAAYRRDDYYGAVRAYDQALTQDPRFALAALGLAMSADRVNAAEQHDRGLAIAWAKQSELSAGRSRVSPRVRGSAISGAVVRR